MEYLFIILSVLAFIGLAQIRRIFEIEANQTRLINSLISAVVGVPLVILFELYILREHVTGVLAFGNFCSYTVFWLSIQGEQNNDSFFRIEKLTDKPDSLD